MTHYTRPIAKLNNTRRFMIEIDRLERRYKEKLEKIGLSPIMIQNAIDYILHLESTCVEQYFRVAPEFRMDKREAAIEILERIKQKIEEADFN